MNKFTAEQRNSRVGSINEIMDNIRLGTEKTTYEEWTGIHSEVVQLHQHAPEGTPDNVKLEILLRSNEIWENLRREVVDMEKERGINPAWVTLRDMALEGHISLLFKKPGDNATYLFRQGDGPGTFKDQIMHQSLIQEQGIQRDGSVFVEHGSELHRKLWDGWMMFRWTSIGPDEHRGGNQDDEVETPLMPIPVETDDLVTA